MPLLTHLPSNLLQLNADGHAHAWILACMEVGLTKAGSHVNEHGVRAHLTRVHQEINHLEDVDSNGKTFRGP